MHAGPNHWLAQLVCLTTIIVMLATAHSMLTDHAGRRAIKQHNRAQNMGALKRAWLTQGAVRIDPIPAYYFGTQSVTGNGTLGGLGALGDALVFGMADDPVTLRLPLSALRWVSFAILKNSAIEDGATTVLAVHAVQDAKWQIHVFRAPDPLAVAHRFHEGVGVPVMREFDLGPAEIDIFEQDIYGQWNYQTRGTAYLAPDHLLVTGPAALNLNNLHAIALGPAKGLGQVTARLLRLSYRREDGSLGGLGLQMSRLEAHRWAESLSRRTSIPMQVYGERKGKEEKLAD
jgi:hypothetical protein